MKMDIFKKILLSSLYYYILTQSQMK